MRTVAVAALAACLPSVLAVTKTYDVVVYGATPGGIAAALTAATYNAPSGSPRRVVIAEPNGNVGGMSAPGGIGLRDFRDDSFVNGIGRTWAMLNAKHYNSATPVWQPDMPVAAASFAALLAASPSVDVIVNAPVQAVSVSGTTIQSIDVMVNGTTVTLASTMFIDASYEGDVFIKAGATFTYGREPSSQYGESLAGVLTPRPLNISAYDSTGKLIKYVNPGPIAAPGTGDDRMMGYSYRTCLTTNTSNQAPFVAPEGYDATDFTLMGRYLNYLAKNDPKYPQGPPVETVFGVYPYRNYPPGNKWDLCNANTFLVTSDALNLNAGYPTGNWTVRDSIAQQVRYYVQGFLYFLASDPSVPAGTKSSLLKYGLCADSWPENGHFPTQMYIREASRIVGDYVVTQADLVYGKCRSDSIGVGQWGVDIHEVQRSVDSDGNVVDEGYIMDGLPGSGNAYDLPYGAILPKRSELTNLLVPVCLSASHVAYGSIRVEPTFMPIGQAAGIAATIALASSSAVQDVPVSAIQAGMSAQNLTIHCSSSC